MWGKTNPKLQKKDRDLKYLRQRKGCGKDKKPRKKNSENCERKLRCEKNSRKCLNQDSEKIQKNQKKYLSHRFRSENEKKPKKM